MSNKNKKIVKTMSSFLAMFLKNHRIKHKKNQTELANELGVSLWLISFIERENLDTEIIKNLEFLIKISDLEEMPFTLFLTRMCRDIRRATDVNRINRRL